MLDAMAAGRAFLCNSARASGVQLDGVITTVVGVRASPKFLRRPSEDWYFVVLMSGLGGFFWAAALVSIVSSFGTSQIKSSLWFWMPVIAIGVIAGIVIALSHLTWAVRFAYEMDLRRERKHGPTTYTLLPGSSDTIPLILRPISKLSAWIETRHQRNAESAKT
jgi:hypothetical protein